jgi:hypothetical protein
MANPVQLPSGISTFGVGRLLYTPAGALGPTQLGLLNDIEVDIKKDLKSAFSEGSFPALVADGHATINITAKGYKFALQDIQQDYGAGIDTVAASVYAWAVDEAGLVSGSHSYTLGVASGYQAGTAVLVMNIPAAGGAVAYQTNYTIVASGSEVAGQSFSISTGGVLNFAPGDNGNTFLVSYQYANTAGTHILINNHYQNSQAPYVLDLIKRDRNPVDGTTEILSVRFFAVRSSGVKVPFKDNDWSDVDRSFMAYQDGTGRVFDAVIVATANGI